MARLTKLILGVVLVWLTTQTTPLLATEILTTKGTIDFHIHSAPDITPRSLNDYQVGKMAATAQMQGIVLKNHYTPTGDRAALVNQLLPGLKLYGGIVLNRSVGGINPEAVRAMVEVSQGKGKVVWFPTVDSAYHLQTFGKNGTGLTIMAQGQLTPETLQVLELIKQYDLVLATGHLAPAEITLLVSKAVQMGIKKILITHPLATVPGLSLTEMQAVAEAGAYLELVYVNDLMGPESAVASHRRWRRVSLEEMARVINLIGPEHFILATDLGREGDPLPVQGYQKFITGLQKLGIEPQAMEVMTRTNPSYLLN